MTGDPNWDGESRRIDPVFLYDHVGDLRRPVFLVAGPPAMAEGVADSLKADGVPEARVLSDKFSGY
jgi:NAD(P)H-flavin reductase